MASQEHQELELIWGSSGIAPSKSLRSGLHVFHEEMGEGRVGADGLLPRWSKKVHSSKCLNLTDGAASEGGSFEFEQLSKSSCVWPYVHQLREHIQRAYVHQLPLFGC